MGERKRTDMPRLSRKFGTSLQSISLLLVDLMISLSISECLGPSRLGYRMTRHEVEKHPLSPELSNYTDFRGLPWSDFPISLVGAFFTRFPDFPISLTLRVERNARFLPISRFPSRISDFPCRFPDFPWSVLSISRFPLVDFPISLGALY